MDGIEYSADGKTLIKCNSSDRDVIVRDGVEVIKEGAFEHDRKMINIYLPISLKVIERRAFFDCDWLVGVHFAEHSVMERIDDYAFSSSLRINFIRLPYVVDSIGKSIFLNCNALRAIEFPYEINSFGTQMWLGQTYPHTIKIPERFKHCLSINEKCHIIGYDTIDPESGLTENALESYNYLQQQYQHKLYCEPFLTNRKYDLGLETYYIDLNEQLNGKYIVRGTAEPNKNKRFVSRNVLVKEYESLKEMVKDGWRCNLEESYVTHL